MNSLQVTKLNESFSLIQGTTQELMKISDFYKVERDGQYFDPMVKRGLKSPYDFFTTSVDYQGQKALLIMNGLLMLHPVLSNYIELEKPDTTVSDVNELLESVKGVLPFDPYDYQKEALIDILTNKKKSLARACTGSGKSILIQLIQEYFRRENKKGILLVPNINLLEQFYNDIKDYNLIDLANDTELIGGDYSVKDVSELTKTLTISTWQSMQNFEGSLDGVDFVMQDECLHPETLIRTKSGLVKIKDLKEGDLVLTVNEDSKELEYKPIEKVHFNLPHSESEEFYDIELDDGSLLTITQNHNVLTNLGWKRADELTTEDEIIGY